MARLARLESPTGYYHLMVRGNNRETIFKKAVEKRYFIELLQHTVEDNKITVVAYCLMDNHVHLLLHSGLQAMSEALKWINIKIILSRQKWCRMYQPMSGAVIIVIQVGIKCW